MQLWNTIGNEVLSARNVKPHGSLAYRLICDVYGLNVIRKLRLGYILGCLLKELRVFMIRIIVDTLPRQQRFSVRYWKEDPFRKKTRKYLILYMQIAEIPRSSLNEIVTKHSLQKLVFDKRVRNANGGSETKSVGADFCSIDGQENSYCHWWWNVR